MADMLELLHDEIDDVEALVSEAAQIVESKRERLRSLVKTVLASDLQGTMRLAALPEAIEIVAGEVEDELSELTTKAFHQGVEFQRKRFRTIR